MTAAPVGRSLWSDAWRRLRKNRMAVACGLVFVVIVLFSFAGPPLVGAAMGIDDIQQNYSLGASPPSWSGIEYDKVAADGTKTKERAPPHLFGTDTLGRDMLVRVMIGGRWAIIIAFTATFLALVIGVSWGAISAYAGGRVDYVMMRIVDVLYGFPTIVFVIVVMATFETKSLFVLFALIGLISWLNMARIVRGQVLGLRHREFVEAGRALGLRSSRILFRHIIPNTLGIIIVYATLALPQVMLTEAFLSFLGLGVQAPRASWGTLVTEGASQIVAYRWLVIFPGVIMGTTIFALNFLGDGLRDALDPQTRKD